MDRRDFIKTSLTGLAFISASSALGVRSLRAESEQAGEFKNVRLNIDMAMEEVMLEMVDKTPVYHWAFRDRQNGFRIPGPVITAVEGDTIRVRIQNRLPGGRHSFAIPGVADTGVIPQGAVRSVTFTAPAPGTYMYLDPLNAPMNRAMGLHGMLIVLPRVGNTPYLNPPRRMQQLFNDLGYEGWSEDRGSDHFPGHPWDPDRAYIWAFHTADSVKHAAVQSNPNMEGAEFRDGYLPDYFMISGKGGAFLSHDLNIGPSGNVGQPALIRAYNAGLNNASPHIHGNHVYMLAENNAVEKRTLPVPHPANGHVHRNVHYIDTWTMRPGDRKDLLLPFVLPPDVPVDEQVDFANAVLTKEEREARGGGEKCWPPVEEPFPLVFPMHDHDEIAQTAAHGNYPQGAVLHWQFNGDIDMEIVEDVFGANRRQVTRTVEGKDGVLLVDRADLFRDATRLGIVIRGRYSGQDDRLVIHAGSLKGPVIARLRARDGHFRFGRVVERAAVNPIFAFLPFVSIRNLDTGATRENVRLAQIDV